MTPELSDDQLRALLKVCAGRDFLDRRDEAILRFMIETGCRAGEVVAMTMDEVDVRMGMALVRRGKGAKGLHAYTVLVFPLPYSDHHHHHTMQ